jgi:hypothetical protein
VVIGRASRPARPGEGGLAAAVLGAVPDDVQVGLLQRGVPRHQLVQGDAVPGGQVADGGRGHAGHREPAVAARRHHRSGRGEQPGQIAGPRRPDQHVVARAGLDELRHRGVGHQPAPADDDEVVRGLRHFGHQVAGHEDGPALRGQRPQEPAQPSDALGVEPVDRLVEQQHRRVAEQRGGDAEPLLHAEREPSGPPVRHGFQPGEPQQLADPAAPDPVALRDRQQMVVRGAPGVQRVRVEQRADLVQRADHVPVPAAADQRRAGGGPVQAEDEPQRGRLARAVRPQEAGHPAGTDREAQPVQRGHQAKPPGQPIDLDHDRAPSAGPRRSRSVIRPSAVIRFAMIAYTWPPSIRPSTTAVAP